MKCGIPARGCPRGRGSRRGALGLGRRAGRPGAVPTRCPAQSGCFCPCARGGARSACWASARDEPGALMRAEQRPLLDALIDQGSLAIERVHLVEAIDRTRRVAETDRLRSALLTSISHDLKTPAGVCSGRGRSAARILQVLRRQCQGRSPGDYHRRIGTPEPLHRQSARYDQARYSVPSLPNAAPHDIGEIVGSALARASKILARHHIDLEIKSGPAHGDGGCRLFEQVLFNLLDNAAKICARGDDGPHPELARSRQRATANSGRRRRYSRGRSRSYLRQILSGAERRPRPCRHRIGGWRSRAASSRLYRGPLRRQTALTAQARYSPSLCPSPNRQSQARLRHEHGLL